MWNFRLLTICRKVTGAWGPLIGRNVTPVPVSAPIRTGTWLIENSKVHPGPIAEEFSGQKHEQLKLECGKTLKKLYPLMIVRFSFVVNVQNVKRKLYFKRN